jgi:predicted O-methyltransferase YrrM
MISAALRRLYDYSSCYRAVQAFGTKSIDDTLRFCLSHPISPLQDPHEIRALLELVAENPPRRVLEIGTARGGTLFLWTRVARHDATIISIDLPGGAFGGGYHWAKIPLYKSFATGDQTIHLVRANSHDLGTREKVRSITQEVDLLFIDGDHSYAGVQNDFRMYSELVRPGGIVVLHDISYPNLEGCEVWRFWDDLKEHYPHQEIVRHPPSGWAGIGVIRMPEILVSGVKVEETSTAGSR